MTDTYNIDRRPPFWDVGKPCPNACAQDVYRRVVDNHVELPGAWAGWRLAAVVNVSRFHFARLFRRSTGMPPIAFVEQCRIRRAQTLIVETDLPLSDIALVIGFADQSHFTRRFHRHVGCAPAQFAREHGRRRRRR